MNKFKIYKNFFFIVFVFLFQFCFQAIDQKQVLAQVDTVIGKVEMPEGVSRANYDKNKGLMQFISNLIKFATIAGGLFVLYNLVMAGFIFLSKSGDSNAYAQLTEKITMSVMGLAVIALAYTIIGLIGLIIFKDAGYILNPTIHGPGTT